MSPWQRSTLTLALLLLGVSVAWAHRAPGSTTRIEWNAREGLTQITHRLHVHDAAIGVAAVAGVSRLDLTTLEGAALGALYVEERFAIEMDGRPVPLQTLGAELVDDYFLVYQETQWALSGALRVANGILRDAFEAQVNEVNLRLGGSVRTLRFAGDDRWHDAPIAKAPP